MDGRPAPRLAVKLIVAAAILAAVVMVFMRVFRPVARVAEVKRDKAVNGIPGSVTVQAERDIEIKSTYGGRVIDVKINRGQRVKAGDTLAQLDTRELKLQIEQTKSDLEAQQKRLEIGSPLEFDVMGAREFLTTQKRQFELGAISSSEVAQAERAVQTLERRLELEKAESEQRLKTLENTLATKELQLEGMTIKAPFDGVVAECKAQPGEIISASQPIARFIMATRVVQARISEENIADVRPGQSATVRFLSYGEDQFSANVIMVSPTADPSTQRYLVDLDVQIDPERLKPGITGEVVINAGERLDALVIPRRAVFGRSVYAVNDGRIELRKVELGYTGLNMVEILSGLKKGERVIVEQLDRYRPGDKVRTETAEN